VYDARAARKIRRTFPTVTAAKQWRADALGEVRRGRLRAVPAITFGQAADAFIAGTKDGIVRTRAGDRYRPSTIRSYEQALRDRVLPHLSARRLASITTPDLQDLVDRMVAKDVDPSTIQNTLNPIRRIYARALQRGEVSLNPSLGLAAPAVRGVRERIAAPEEARRLLDALLPDDRAIYATAFYAGLRLGELQALEYGPDGLDLGGGRITVSRAYDQKAHLYGPPKSKAGYRTIPIAAILRDELIEHAARRSRREGLVFQRPDGKPFWAAAVERRAKTAWKHAGLDKICLHEARHTFASLLIEAGENPKRVATYMGHADVATTLNVYAKLFEGHEQDTLSKLDALLERHDTGARVAQLEARQWHATR